MNPAEKASTPSGRVHMKQQAQEFAERLTPVRMRVMARRGEHEELVKAGDGTLYVRDRRRTPEPYPVALRDRVSGRIKWAFLAKPTAPLRRLNP